MQVIRGRQHLSAALGPSVVTIGNFDGVHLGHQALIQNLRQAARYHHAYSSVILFEPQPMEFFRAHKAPARLTPLKDKLALLQQAGIEQVLCLQFNATLAGLSATEFVQEILVESLHAKHIIIGDDFHFGHNREGDFTFLQQLAAQCNYTVTATSSVLQGRLRISSSTVRAALALGDFEQARALLGRAYTMSGRVIHGQALARQWGVPTANIRCRRTVSPLMGAYIARVIRIDDCCVNLPAVCSVGVRPTVVSEGECLLEVHCLTVGADFDVYGKQLGVEFIAKLHDEICFASVDALRRQIEQDVQAARNYFVSDK